MSPCRTAYEDPLCRQVESKKTAKSWGHTIIAIRPDGFVDGFADKAASVCATVKAAGPSVSRCPASGVCYPHPPRSSIYSPCIFFVESPRCLLWQVRLPGESSAKIAAERTAVGKVPVPKKVWEMILKTGTDGL